MSQTRRPSRSFRLRSTATLLAATVAAFVLAARSTALPAAPAVEAPGLAVLAQHGGSVGPVLTDGEVLYVAVGTRIEAYDVADATRPVLLGSSPPLPALVQSLALDLDRRHLYATVLRGGLHAFAIDHDPVPRPLGVLQIVAANVVDLHIVGNAAILGDRAAGLVVIDVADPTAPRHVATVDIRTARDSEDTMPIVAVGRRGSNLAVVAMGSDRHQLILYDASDPASLVELGRTDLDDRSNVRGAVWLGDYVYSASLSQELRPFDVSNLAAPRALEVVPPPEGVSVGGVYAGEDHLYRPADLGMGESGLIEYTLDDPARPALVTIHRDGPSGVVHAAGKRLYSFTNGGPTADTPTLGIFERAADGALLERGGIHLSLAVIDAAAVGPMLWFTGNWALLAIDPADPGRPAIRWPTV